MKRNILPVLTALLCLPVQSAAVSAAEQEIAYTYVTDRFSYANNCENGVQNGFFLKSDLPDVDFMVVGLQSAKDAPDEVTGFYLTPVNDNGVCFDGGVGILLCTEAERALGTTELHVGDLLAMDGVLLSAAVTPAYHTFTEAELTRLGSGTELLGDAFRSVIRSQIAAEQAYCDSNTAFRDVELLMRGDADDDGDISIMDCIATNKYILGAKTFDAYTKVAADTDRNGSVDTTDALNILKAVVGMTS